jgi:hypothetical protein
MPQDTPAPEIIAENQYMWNTGRLPAGCSHCRRAFLVVKSDLGKPCPLCREGQLAPQPVRMRPAPPERLLPFKILQQNLAAIYDRFVEGVWIAPEDFKTEHLLARTRPLFWPMWLVDSDISGQWQMEAGFDYQVESAKETYTGGEWRSRKQIEDRIRWEPRVGSLEYHVDNVAVPALEEHNNRLGMTGHYPLDSARAFESQVLGNAPLEVPDLPPENAWPLAKPQVDKTAGQVCAQAAYAQHFRNFAIRAEYHHLNWTQFLLPLYATHYTDDDGHPQIILVNGQTGQINGPRLASRKRGLRIAGVIAAIAGAFLLMALLALALTLVFPPAGIIAGLLGLVGIPAAIGAIIPAVWPGQWNRKQNPPRIATHE